VPRELEDEHVSINAQVPGQGDVLKVTRVDKLSLAVLSKFTDKNASDLIFFRVELPASNDNKGFYAITVKELYKRRKEPFPSKIGIHDDHQIKFADSKYYLTVYPTKSQRLQIIYDASNTM
jgi:hypothetical protein